MSRTLIALLLASASGAAAAAADTYTMDPIHSIAYFGLDHLGLAKIYGRFDKMSGKFTLDKAERTGSAELAIETATLNTGDSERGSRPRTRDEHARSSDFLNVAEFPRMTFKSTAVKFNGDTPVSLEGNLTMLGVSKPVTLNVDQFKCNPAQGTRKERCGGNVSGKIKRSDWGMKYGIPSIGDEIVLMISIEGDKD